MTQLPLFDLPDAPRPPADTPAPPRFVPEFDNLVLAHEDRTRVVADEHRGAIVTKNLLVRATILVEGVVSGTWTLERKKDAVTVAVAPFGTLAKKVRSALEEEGTGLARFTEPDAKTYAVEFG